MKGPTSSDKRLRLFENRWLEKLTVISVGWFMTIWSIGLIWLGVSAWGTVPLVTIPPLIVCGWFLFTGLEYVAHRFLFHLKPKTDLMAKVVFVMHGNHHMQPMDKLRSLMPPIVSLPIGYAVASILSLAFGVWSAWMLFGFVLGYVAYELTQNASPMRGAWAKRFKRHHLLHHFMSEDGNYAVTGLFWDTLMGTKLKAGKGARAARSVHRPVHHPAHSLVEDAFDPAD